MTKAAIRSLPSDLCPKPAGANPCQGRSSDSSLLPRLPGFRASGIACGNRRLPRGEGTYSSRYCSGFSPDSLFIGRGVSCPVPKPCGAKIRIRREKKQACLHFFRGGVSKAKPKIRENPKKAASLCGFFRIPVVEAGPTTCRAPCRPDRASACGCRSRPAARSRPCGYGAHAPACRR